MTRLAALILALALFAVACGGSSGTDDGNVFGVPDCSEFVDGQPVPAYSLTEADDGGPGASCFNSETNSLVLSAVWDCDDGTSFIGRDDGYYLESEGVWRVGETNAEDRSAVYWECLGVSE